jgi:Flp pilus assembly protein TadB
MQKIVGVIFAIMATASCMILALVAAHWLGIAAHRYQKFLLLMPTVIVPLAGFAFYRRSKSQKEEAEPMTPLIRKSLR